MTEKLTEDRIERRVERATDALDARLIAGRLTQEEYDREIKALDQWATEQAGHMSQSLEETIHRLWNLDTSLKPVPFADKREAAIVDGLNALAGNFGKEIDFTYIDANGELTFNIKGASRGLGGEYGEELAALLSQVPRRTGISPTSSPVLPENNWCRINHFDAERLLKIAGEEIFGIEGPDSGAGPKSSR